MTGNLKERLEIAMAVASPSLMLQLGTLPEHFEKGSVARDELEGTRGATMTRVRRIVAALNGVDVLNQVAGVKDVLAETPAILPRDLAERLKAALLNGAMSAALSEAIGPREADALLGDVAAL